MKETVLVGMSGGVDSLVTALLLQQRGYRIVGVVLELWEKNDTAVIEEICQTFDIPLFFQEERSLFREKVVEPFIATYLAGCTPSPCCFCNSEVKWRALYQIAKQHDIPYIATGHYVRIEQLNGKYYIRCGVDVCKDQSYFFYNLPQEILAKALTPLGDYTKEEIKKMAVKWGYEKIVQRKESMGICFLAGKDYREFIREQIGNEKMELPGVIVDKDGVVLGEHQGLLHYTIGQKRGMPMKEGKQLYVAEMDAQNHRIIADFKSALWTSELYLKEMCWVDESNLLAADITIKVRGIGLNPQGFVKVKQLSEKEFKVELSEPAWAVAPGQPVALFRKDLLIGGGIVTK